MVFCYIAILFTGLLYFVRAGNYWRGAFFFIMAGIGFEGSIVYYNAFLPEISTDQNIGRISGASPGAGGSDGEHAGEGDEEKGFHIIRSLGVTEDRNEDLCQHQ